MKKLNSKLFQKFENNEVKNLGRVIGGAWVNSYHGGSTVPNDCVNTETIDENGNYPAADTQYIW